jgi:putative phosphoribosyl transferase
VSDNSRHCCREATVSEFDIVIPRKLTDPDNKEQAIGAILEDGTTYIEHDLINHLRISSEYLGKEKLFQMEEIRRKAALFRNPTPAILVDDGVATDATINSCC